MLKQEMCRDPQPCAAHTRGASSAAVSYGPPAQFSPPIPFYRGHGFSRPGEAPLRAAMTLAWRLQGLARPPVWRAVVRPARSFFSESCCAKRGILPLARDTAGGPHGRAAPLFAHGRCRQTARRRTNGTKVSKSTGFGTCRSNPASIAAATSLGDTYPVTAMASMRRPA